MRRALVIGAGSIGRGFLAQLFYEAGYALTFVDADAHLVDALNRAGRYCLRLVGDSEQSLEIGGFRALQIGRAEEVSRAAAEAEVVCTAAGASALPSVARMLAAGIAARSEPLNVILCENLPDANRAFLTALTLELERTGSADAAPEVGGVRAVVSRMTPVAPFAVTGSLDLKAEPYRLLPLDASAMVTRLGLVDGMLPVASFEAWMARKLYTHNASHAALGYAGAAHGCRFAADALALPPVKALVEGVMSETGPALCRLMGFEPAEQREYEQQLQHRFSNRSLGDTCERLARDPIRKLGHADRLAGAALLCRSAGIEVRWLPRVMALALKWRSAEDGESMELERLVNRFGPLKTIAQVCALEPNDPLAVQTAAVYSEHSASSGKFAGWC
ncbi:MAG: hypothetical protein KGJ62_08855 [Armatimonadetes bacterium]|nr:hypothetical protein [Armatimonadota bacterium]MDE2207708.1 hypothetical protein [Armatimonadota bacterium]